MTCPECGGHMKCGPVCRQCSMRIKRRPLAERLWAKVDRRGDEDCWPWLGCIGTKGYGMFHVGDDRYGRAHRVAYEVVVGPVPAGLVIDHLCRNRSCCNPAHLEPVTSGENTRRGVTGAHHRAKTHCPAGHPYDDKNTYPMPQGGRGCRECRNEASRRHRERKRAGAAA